MPTDKLISGHRRFRDRFATERDVFEALARHGQRPAVMWIGCADSRVIPELITGADPGDLFVVRNIGGIVPPAGEEDAGVGAAVEYAVLQLGLSHIVVCGHTECGGLRALADGVDPARMPHAARWLAGAAPALAVATAAPASLGPDAALLRAHVQRQRDNLLAHPCVAAAAAQGRLAVHAWLYDVHSGALLAEDGGVWRDVGHGAAD